MFLKYCPALERFFVGPISGGDFEAAIGPRNQDELPARARPGYRAKVFDDG